MQVLLFADTQAQEWHAAAQAIGHAVGVYPLGSPTQPLTGDVCLVVAVDHAALLTARFWLPTLPAPICLVTTAQTLAETLGQHAPALRVVCHPLRAIGALDDLLTMTMTMHAGLVWFGPHATVARARVRGGADAR